LAIAAQDNCFTTFLALPAIGSRIIVRRDIVRRGIVLKDTLSVIASPAVAACAATASSSLNLLFRARFFSPSRFLDEPQPRKTNCEDHHDDENGVLGHRIRLELLHQYCSPSWIALPYLDLPLDSHQRGLLFCVPSGSNTTVSERTMALTTMAYLERRYAALEKEITDALRHRPPDDRAIDDLTYRRLIVADEIRRGNWSNGKARYGSLWPHMAITRFMQRFFKSFAMAWFRRLWTTDCGSHGRGPRFDPLCAHHIHRF
jgi:hypothetical protein